MKNIFFIIFIFLQTGLPSFANKNIEIYFPDDEIEKRVIVRYSLLDLPNYVYEPYIHTYPVKGNQLAISIPDSILFFTMSVESSLNYEWSGNVMILIPSGDTLSIVLDKQRKPYFRGKSAETHQYLYGLRGESGMNRAKATLNRFLSDTTTHSFLTFIRKIVDKDIKIIKHLDLDKEKDKFIKNLMIDEYLFRAGLIATGMMNEVRLKMDSIDFYQDMSSLYENYAISFNSGISSSNKANLRYLKLISGNRLKMGYDYTNFPHFLYLNKEEQAAAIATEIICGAAIGMYEAEKLTHMCRLYEQVYIDSPYRILLNELKLPKRDDNATVFAYYSSETGLNKYENSSDLSEFIKKFVKKPVLIDFWATWCIPCIKEIRHGKTGELNTFLKNNNIERIYVSVDYPAAYEKWETLLQQEKMDGFHYFATDKVEYPYFKHGESIPRYVLLDENGNALITKCELPTSGKIIYQIKEALGL